ncbi:MAG: marine proteobacterial sortase target protein [Candidatus Thiodiazotropha sp.]
MTVSQPSSQTVQPLPFNRLAFIREVMLSLLAALMTGLAGGLLLILLVFSWGNAQAGTSEQPIAELQLKSLDGRLLGPAPLLNTDVSAEMTGPLARVRVEQVFRNISPDWMEGRYQFPLPEGCAVEYMRMQIGTRLIDGQIREKAAAKREYDQARSAGKGASLLTQQRPNVFTLAVTNIGPGEQVRIRIEYQQRLTYENRGYSWRFPMVIGPRYRPTGPDVDGQLTEAVSPPVIAGKPGLINPLSLQVTLAGGDQVEAVTSRYHPVVEERSGDRQWMIRLADGEIASDRDFVLDWRLRSDTMPQAQVFTEHWEGHDYAMLMVLPPADDAASPGLPRELTLVLDRSGSMSGPSIRQAKAALQLALERLAPHDRFNLIAFNEHSQSLFSHSQPATPGNLTRARDFIGGVQASGGTEMLPALQLALGQAEPEGYLHQLVFLTDGSVGNEQALFELIRTRLGKRRLFTIGIGSAPNSHFMEQAAEYGRGSFSYIGAVSEVSRVMQELFSKLEHPAMANLRLDWEGSQPLEVEPAQLPDLYLGEPLTVALRSSSLQAGLQISGVRGETIWKQRLNLDTGQMHRGVHTLWARARIKSLMADDSLGQESRRQEVLAIALEHQLISPYTSLVAVEQQPSRPLEKSLTGGDIPVSLPHGWSATAVFGSLPQTATPAVLYQRIGLLLLLLGAVIRHWQRSRASGVVNRA